MNFISLVSPFMHRVLCHIYGPLTVYSYGCAIALGMWAFIILIQRDKQFRHLKLETLFPSILLIGIIAGISGGKLLYLLTEPADHVIHQWSDFQAGFSILGCIFAILLIIPWYIYQKGIPILPFFDIVAIYAPIMHAISRLGCFASGCCYGMPTSLFWGVMYTDPQSAAPLYSIIHPTQLYSAVLFLCLFIFMYYKARIYITWPGGLLSCYLMGAGFERFCVDFFRADRIFFHSIACISIYQIYALILVMLGIILLLFKKYTYAYEYI